MKLLTLLMILTVGCASRSYDVANYKDGVFKNHQKDGDKSFWSYLWMRMKTDQAKWPEEVPLGRPTAKPEPRSDALRIYYVNHSTFLIQYKNINILTDPVFSERVSPVTWAGPRRVISPGVRFDDLPVVDVVLISHDHYDHLDIASLQKIFKRDQPEILLGLGAGRVFETEKFREMAWGDEFISGGVKYIFTPAQHFSGRGLFDRNTTLWGSFVIQFSDLKVYFAGDTGYSSHFSEARERYGDVDIALLPVGAYAPRDFMKFHHTNPEEAFQAYKDLGAKMALGMHWGTFQLTNEPRTEPRERLLKIAEAEGDTGFLVPENGQCFKRDADVLVLCP